MDLHYLLDNLTNPALLFFFLGLIAVNLKSDLKIPENSSKFISFIGHWFQRWARISAQYHYF